MTFRRVSSYSTDKPAQLERELAQLEENIAAEFSSARSEVIPRPPIVTFIATPTRNTIAILPGQ